MELILILALVLSSTLSVYLINFIFKFEIKHNKYAAIEGFRGYLAFFVFLHHLIIWFSYLHTKNWSAPYSNLFNQLGKTSVSFFFMITGFLFFNKLIQGGFINWKHFYVNRFLRLFPLYFFTILILILIVLIQSDFFLYESVGRFIDHSLHWIFFNYFGTKDINFFSNTWIINAGVVWSLKYEILFYASLPFFGLIYLKKHKAITLCICAAMIGLFFLKMENFSLVLLLNFLAGYIAAMLIKKYPTIGFMKSKITSILCLVLLIFNIKLYNNSENVISIFLQSLVFIAIVYGNNFMGLLTLKYTQILGQISYSIYLTHGIVLFICNTFLINHYAHYINNLNFNEYLLLGLGYTFLVILFSFLTHKYIELPFLNFRKK